MTTTADLTDFADFGDKNSQHSATPKLHAVGCVQSLMDENEQSKIMQMGQFWEVPFKSIELFQRR
jgi:hypothetical protein